VIPAPAWATQRRRGPAAALVGEWPPPPGAAARLVAFCDVTGPGALVLGRAQDEGGVDHAAAAARGLGIVRRSGGGGAVLVTPGAQVWAEIWLPRADPLWDDDVVAGARWVGRAWARALASLGARDLEVHPGRATRTDWSDTVCFAGVGPGEVVAGGRKVVGLSQRRTRAGARFHTVAPLHWDAEAMAGLVRSTHGAASDRRREDLVFAATGLDSVVGSSGVGTSGGEGTVVRAVERALILALP
jgi:lipoate-protein ligase A